MENVHNNPYNISFSIKLKGYGQGIVQVGRMLVNNVGSLGFDPKAVVAQICLPSPEVEEVILTYKTT